MTVTSETSTGKESAAPSFERQRVPSIIGFSALYGGLLAVLAYGLDLPFSRDVSILFGLALSFIFGAFVGLLSSPFVLAALVARDPRKAKPIILWIAAAVVVILSFIFADDELLVLMALAAAAFVAASLLARGVLPRVWDAPGLCRRCGYDIRASVPFNRCPECGTSLDEDLRLSGSYDGSGARGRLTRIACLLLRRPAVPLLILILCLIGPALGRHGLRNMRRRMLMAATEQAASTGIALDLAKSAAFDWEEVYVFPPYTHGSTIKQTLPFSSPELDRIPRVDDAQHLLVFVRDRSVAEWVMLTWSIEYQNLTWAGGFRGFADSCCRRPIQRDVAVFDVVEASDGQRVIIQRSQKAGSRQRDAP